MPNVYQRSLEHNYMIKFLGGKLKRGQVNRLYEINRFPSEELQSANRRL